MRVIFGSTRDYSDSTSSSYYPCPPRHYGIGFSLCHTCPSGVQVSKMNDFSLGIRSVVGSHLICDQGSFSIDGKTCIDSCQKGCTYHAPRFNDGTLSGCRACKYARFYSDPATNLCERCPNGKYSNGSGFNCHPCPIGEYAPSTGMEGCFHCTINLLPFDESI